MVCRRFVMRALPVLLVLTLGACVLGDRKIMLDYPPKSGSGVVPEAKAAPAPVTAGTEVALASFGDEREEKKAIGDTQNAYGMRMADVIAVNDVPTWVTSAVRSEMEAAGFTVIDEPSAEVAARVLMVSGEVVKVYTTAYWSYEADVTFHARVQKGKAVLLDKVYSGEGSAGTNWAATERAYGQSLSLALQDAARKFVGDLGRLEVAPPSPTS